MTGPISGQDHWLDYLLHRWDYFCCRISLMYFISSDSNRLYENHSCLLRNFGPQQACLEEMRQFNVK